MKQSISQACFWAGVRPPKFKRDGFDAEAERYVNEHPDAWILFCRFAQELVDAGAQQAGAKAIVERIRWEARTSAHGVGRDYAWDNSLTSSIARAWARVHPEYDLFRFRGASAA